MQVTKLGRRSPLWILLVSALALPACASWSTLPGEASAFRTGQVGWAAFMLGHSYATSLRENRRDCYLDAFDADEVALANFGTVDDQTKKSAAEMLKAAFDNHRKEVGWAYPGAMRFDSDAGGDPYLIPPVHRAFVSPLKECPSLRPPMGEPAPWGKASGTLTVDFPEKNKQVELKVRISDEGYWITRIPLVRPAEAAEPQAPPSPAPPPEPAPPPAPAPADAASH